MGLLADISSLITTESNKYLGDMPDTPNNLICMYSTSGYSPLINQNKDMISRPTFQIVVRDASYASAESRIEAIKSLLNTVCNTTINGSFYMSIRQESDILSLGKDEKNRTLLSVNFKANINK